MEKLKLFQDKTLLIFLFVSLNLWGNNEGISFGNETRNYYKNNFNSAVVNPLTSDKDFKTMDGKKEFKASLTCNNNVSSFLKISYSGTSDINVNVSIDTDLNNSFDKNYSFSGISGVATNGVIKCNVNSWANCKYYSWKIYNSNLILEQVHRNDLSGAYCINSSCGNLAQYNKTDILNTLGGAISSIYQSYSSQYLITKTSNNGSLIEFYGQEFEECNNLNSKSTLPKFTSSADDSNLDYSSELITQSNNPNSAYVTLQNNISNQNTNKNLSDDFKDDLTFVNSNVNSEVIDQNNYTFSYSSKRKNDSGEWEDMNGTGKVNLEFLSPEIKYCEVSYLVTNSQLLSDGETKHSSTGEQETYKVEMRECTGTDYNTCPLDTSKGELISAECGVNNSFSKVTSMMYSLQEMSNDITCHQGE